MKLKITDTVKGWSLLTVGAIMVSFAFGLVWGIPVALGIAGLWTVVFGISVVNK
jgi:hypothetical protein